MPDAPQTKEPYVLRLEPRDVERLKKLAHDRGLGHSTNARLLLLHALRMAEIEEVLKNDKRITA